MITFFHFGFHLCSPRVFTFFHLSFHRRYLQCFSYKISSDLAPPTSPTKHSIPHKTQRWPDTWGGWRGWTGRPYIRKVLTLARVHATPMHGSYIQIFRTWFPRFLRLGGGPEESKGKSRTKDNHKTKQIRKTKKKKLEIHRKFTVRPVSPNN